MLLWNDSDYQSLISLMLKVYIEKIYEIKGIKYLFTHTECEERRDRDRKR